MVTWVNTYVRGERGVNINLMRASWAPAERQVKKSWI
jgi:hypothetical protein